MARLHAMIGARPSSPQSVGYRAGMAAYLAVQDVDCLDPAGTPGVLELENWVVNAVAEQLGGTPQTAGIFTNGGTESIMLALKAARDLRPGTRSPHIVVPITAHAAFHKAAAYLGLRVRVVGVDPVTCLPEPDEIASAIDDDTILVGASAPSSATGVVDPIVKIAAVAAAHGVDLHVDACAGGWVLPWMRANGADVPPFDLSVPGVSSISCDLHKFGGTPKSASVVLFAERRARQAAYHACASWSGYASVTSTVQSGRSAGPLAGAWASLQATGTKGYLDLAASLSRSLAQIVEGVTRVPGLRVLGRPDGPMLAVAYDPDDGDIFAIADAAAAYGLTLACQLSNGTVPASLRINLTGLQVPAQDVLGILRLAVADATSTSDRRPTAQPVVPEGMVRRLVADISDVEFASLLGALGVGPGAGSDPRPGQAPLGGNVARLLNQLPAVHRELLLTRFTSLLYSTAPFASPQAYGVSSETKAPSTHASGSRAVTVTSATELALGGSCHRDEQVSAEC